MTGMTFLDGLRGWAWGTDSGGSFYLYRTLDGGETWNKISVQTAPRGSVGVTPPQPVVCLPDYAALNRPLTLVSKAGVYQGWRVYDPAGYNFHLNFPSDWKASEGTLACGGSTPELHFLTLVAPANTGAVLTIGFRMLDHQVMIIPKQLLDGTGSIQGSIPFFGQIIDRWVVESGGQVIGVYYQDGQEITSGPGGAIGVAFSFSLEQSAPQVGGLTQQTQDLVDQIVKSVQLNP